LGEIRGNATKSSDLVKEIRSQSQEQSSVIGQLGSSVIAADKIAKKNLSAADQLTGAFSSFMFQSGLLDTQFKQLYGCVLGSTAEASSSRRGASDVRDRSMAHRSSLVLGATAEAKRTNVQPGILKEVPARKPVFSMESASISSQPANHLIPLDDGDFQGF
jgi:hypothetical protein